MHLFFFLKYFFKMHNKLRFVRLNRSYSYCIFSKHPYGCTSSVTTAMRKVEDI